MTSRAQVDKLGERLKAGPTTEADLRLLDEYRLTFAGAYQSVIDQVEVQIRTIPQQVWAQISEKLADGVDPTLKYGGGPPRIRQALEAFSEAVSRVHDAGGTWTLDAGSMSTLAEALESIDRRPRAKD